MTSKRDLLHTSEKQMGSTRETTEAPSSEDQTFKCLLANEKVSKILNAALAFWCHTTRDIDPKRISLFCMPSSCWSCINSPTNRAAALIMPTR